MSRQAINALAFIVMLVVNGLANALPLNGQTTGQISDRFQVFFVPAGYVFSIWGLIYLGLIGYVIYRALPAQRRDARLRSIDALFVVSCVANAVWIVLWHYEFFAFTLIAMFILLTSLVAIYLTLDIGWSRVSAGKRWLVHVPFSIYLGWVTVATIANVTSVLYWAGWDGWGIPPQIWAVVMLVVGLAVATSMSYFRGDIGYLAVIVWAYVGIAVKMWTAAPLVGILAAVFAAIVTVTLVAGLIRRLRPEPAHA
jgi:hypothetical protein